MNSHDIRLYFRSLFEALAAVHRHGIIHRDIKPTLVVSHSLRKINADLRRNFLYDIERKRGVLVDFGLAEVFCQHRSLVLGLSVIANPNPAARKRLLPMPGKSARTTR